MDFKADLSHNAAKMFRHWKFILILAALNCLAFLAFAQISCSPVKSREPVSRFGDVPPIILWAWERPENLEFIDTEKFGVAFLAQTLVLENDEVIYRPRRQRMKLRDGTYLIAVTRIETSKPALSDKQLKEALDQILMTLERRNVKAIQIDFDAAVSQRGFYRKLLTQLRNKMPENIPLSITALASFCVGDQWFKDLPIDEAVPMIFRMGADDKNIKAFLASGSDFPEPLCQTSYGISVDELPAMQFLPNRRLYVFSPREWKLSDLERLPKQFQP
jgi:hypothetical protein